MRAYTDVLTCAIFSMRGFMLGFGGAILKDLLVDRKASASADADKDYKDTFQFARVCGLGSACFLVGAAILVPAQWRYNILTLKNEL